MVSGELPSASGGLAAGSTIAGYRIEEQIGRGGMAVVYRASDIRLNRTVALKVLAPQLADDAGFRHRFSREMRSAAAVDHPHVVPVFDAGEADGALYIAMRYVPGQDVRTLLNAEHTLPPARVTHIVTQVASALDEAHARGLVHRDVKPGNMLIAAVAGSNQPDHVYLSDFGLSKQALASAILTLTGQCLGTLDYMAPEQAEGREVDGRADLYALACSAFEMLAGAPPFRRDQDLAVLWAQLSAPAPSLTALCPDLPQAVDQVLAKAMAKSASDRYQTCAAFASALRTACGLTTEPSGQPGALAPKGPPTEMAHIADPHPDTTPPVASAPAAAAPPAGASAPAPPPAAAPPPAPTPAPASPPAAAPLGPAPWERSPQPHPATSTWSTDAPPGPPRSPGAPWPADGPASQRQAPPPLPSWPQAPPQYTGRYPGGTTKRRGRAGPVIAVVAGCLALLAIGGIVLAVLHHRGSPPRPAPTASAGPATPARSASQSGTATAGPLGPAETVQAYFAAINAHNYARAWELGGKNIGSSFTSFVQGFDTTASDKLTIVSVSGNVVSIQLAATQTDGTVNNYQGTYTVADGVITGSDVEPAG